MAAVKLAKQKLLLEGRKKNVKSKGRDPKLHKGDHVTDETRKMKCRFPGWWKGEGTVD